MICWTLVSVVKGIDCLAAIRREGVTRVGESEPIHFLVWGGRSRLVGLDQRAWLQDLLVNGTLILLQIIPKCQ